MTSNLLAGRSALIIGGKSGIGAAVARQMTRAGARVAVADIPPNVLPHRFAMTFHECDVRYETSVSKAIDATIEQFGKLDILVNNAAVANGMPFLEMGWEEWDQTLQINLNGVAYGMRHALPHMIERGYGRIINTASQLAHKPAPDNAAYCASKAAVVALSASVAQEVASTGVTVNCVCPGPTDTPMWRGSGEAWKAWKVSQLPIKRVGTPDEIASAYIYLASEGASFMIGQSISPNGGDVMW
ncbi:SDR family NAD(P)-dependent oxidoreductase [Mesorhizobium sp. WSM4976]|uniref:SDR family NAD(P)-dependent oxidoreductase n=1 Tax=Mesorhizobium sp. WSM4976 TaxID=3038549 RepID=UPI0024167C5C|nr:SDR family oxidoreductase [Mesorhizobium sp. WSM4976]MDG4892428.1 SDR family NAD(P)-dependent oxidoreductase [Mesorhizobium sp. WSM4976]